MTTLREAAQQALEALEAMQSYAAAERKGLRICDESITALRAALAEPVQEPAAWMHTNGVGHVYFRKKPQDRVFNPQPLYTAPPQRKPLTDDEIADAANSVKWSKQYHVDFARAIERAHGIGVEE